MTKLNDWLALDHRLTEKATTVANTKFTRGAATVLAHSGDSLLWLFGGVLLWRFSIGFWAHVGKRVVLITALTWIVSTILKYFFQRPRPEGEQGLFYLKLDQHSFPSGHAVRAGGLIVALSGILPVWGTLALFAWGIAVGVSRVVLGLHYAGDVAVGVLIGMGCGVGLTAIL